MTAWCHRGACRHGQPRSTADELRQPRFSTPGEGRRGPGHLCACGHLIQLRGGARCAPRHTFGPWEPARGPRSTGAGAYGARLLAWADDLQRSHGLLGFPYAVVRKYGDDAGGRQAALITYYGFLSIFPLLLVAVSILSRVLVDNAALRADMEKALVPLPLQETVETALTSMPSSGLPLAVGVVGLLFSGTGVVFSAYETLNHLAGVPLRSRFGFMARYARVLLMLVIVVTAGLVVAALTVAAAALPDVVVLQRVSAAASTAAVVFLVLISAAKVLVARPVLLRDAWLAAAGGALAVTIVLTAGARPADDPGLEGGPGLRELRHRCRHLRRLSTSSARRWSTPPRRPWCATTGSGREHSTARDRHRPTCARCPGWRPSRSVSRRSGSRSGSILLSP